MQTVKHPSHFHRAEPPAPTGVEIARGFGIPVVLDRTLLLAALFVVLTVVLGPFGALHQDWSQPTLWTVAGGAAVGLFLSIYLHELGHALVAARFGLQTRRITLFVLGGMAQMASEPKSARSEFWIAVAGPAASLTLGAALLGIVSVADAEVGPTLQDAPEAYLRALGPATSLALWLGNINIVLGLFNLIPAFPLDGGRVLRAAVWAATGDNVRSTRWASKAGRWLGWTFIAAGVAMLFGIYVPFFGVGLGGLWLAFIGWFIIRTASASVDNALLQRGLAGRTVGSLMQRGLTPAYLWNSLLELVDGIARPRNQSCVPVLKGDGTFAGLITPIDVNREPHERWAMVRAEAVMTPVSELVIAHEGDDALAALQALQERGGRQLPVLDAEGRYLGMLSADQISRWHGARR